MLSKLSFKAKFIFAALVTATFLSFNLQAMAQTKNSQGGFLDFNLYPYLSDVDNDNVFTLNIASKLDNRISYFSLLNIGNQSGKSELDDTLTYYTEQNIRWQITEDAPLDLTLQFNFRSGADNDRHRLGIRWRLNNTNALQEFFKTINLSYAINLHFLTIDNEAPHVWQLEHAFFMKFPYLSKKLYLAGFIDHTFNQDLAGNMPKSPIVAEAQLGYEVMDNFFIITEYRIIQYRRSDVNNLAVGLQYKMNW